MKRRRALSDTHQEKERPENERYRLETRDEKLPRSMLDNASLFDLVSQEHLLRTVMDCVPDYLFVKDAASRFVVANAAVANDLGLSVGDLIGKTDYNLHPQELAEKFFVDEQVVLSSGQPTLDRKSTRLNSSHVKISYAVF